LGRVACIAVEGLYLWFNSNDHRPPHFHALKAGEYELRIYFLECTTEHLEYEVKWGKAGRLPSSALLKTLRECAVENRVALLSEWESKVCQE
jgi:Domain of unknown function (DUF4160)